MIRAPEMQEVFCDEGYQRLLGGNLHMHWAGVLEAFEDAGNKAKGAALLASAADNPCSLFLLLRICVRGVLASIFWSRLIFFLLCTRESKTTWSAIFSKSLIVAAKDWGATVDSPLRTGRSVILTTFFYIFNYSPTL